MRYLIIDQLRPTAIKEGFKGRMTCQVKSEARALEEGEPKVQP